MKNDTSMIPLRLRSTSYTESANLKENPFLIKVNILG